MAKKKKGTKYKKHVLYHTRVGFYALAGFAIILSLAAINYAGSSDTAVLGKSDEDRGRKEEKTEEQKQEAEKKNEERKQDIERKFKVETEDLELEIKSNENQVERKIKPQEVEDELDDEDENELEDKIEQEFEEEHEIEIASEDGDLVLKKDKIKTKVRTGFPLSIDVATNQLIITRPDGSTKAAAILPDQAVENFTRHKKMNFIGESSGTTSAEMETSVSLVSKEGETVYEIKGKKKLKVLGFIPVEATTTGYVSTETGEVVDEQEGLLTNILDLLSP